MIGSALVTVGYLKIGYHKIDDVAQSTGHFGAYPILQTQRSLQTEKYIHTCIYAKVHVCTCLYALHTYIHTCAKYSEIFSRYSKMYVHTCMYVFLYIYIDR